MTPDPARASRSVDRTAGASTKDQLEKSGRKAAASKARLAMKRTGSKGDIWPTQITQIPADWEDAVVNLGSFGCILQKLGKVANVSSPIGSTHWATPFWGALFLGSMDSSCLRFRWRSP